MKHLARLWLLSVIVCHPSAGLAQWVSVGDGIDYQEFTAAGPNNLFVSRMTRSNPNATIDTTIAHDQMAGALEIVRSQAARQDDAITWWGGSWGARNDVVVAINGGFYTPSTGVIEGGQIQSGWYAHWFADRGAFSGFAWKTDRTAFHGECVDHQNAKVYVRFVSAGASQVIDGINRAPGSSDLVIFTPQYDSRTPSGTRTEVLVEMSRPNLTTSGSGYSSGIIRSKATNTGSTWIPFDHLVLSADGSEGTTLNANATVGAEVRIFQELVETNEPDVQGNYACQTETGVNWANVFASINTNYHFLENNVVRVPDAVAHPGYAGYVNLNPRTAICWNSSYVFFVICDGRSAQSIGMSCETLGNWAKSVLGATDGVNLDGGGSSTMVVNGSVTNVPSDGSERAVCNGIMMVNVQPKQQSTQFTAGQTIYTLGQANCRLGPGTNYGTITTIASGTQGTILSHAIMGVYAKGNYWWKCSFGGTVGWVAQSLLTATPGATPPSITQQPSDQTVGAGDTATFTVAAVGDGTLSYQWQKNGTNLANGGHYSGATTTTLTIAGCDNSDAAAYRCVVISEYGTATSNAATLTVGPPTTEFIVESRQGGKNFGNYSETGTWGNSDSYKSTAAGCTAGIGHRWCTIGSTAVTAVFSFTPSTTGTYEVFTTNCTTSNSGDPLLHKVAHAGGTVSVGVCQNTTCASNAVNKWYSLGQYVLNAGTPYSVTLDGSTGAGSAPAGNAGRSDAIKWSLLSSDGPTITQHPSNQTVNAGGTATFAVAATGSGTLTYQWQKNQSNLSNGGHYSGAITATLTVSSADNNDAANYRCVVTNSYGSATSDEASLTIATCTTPTLLNGGFEGGNTGGIATNWTGYTRPEAPTTVAYTIQTASPAEGSQYQQIQTSYVASGGAGVHQVVTGCTSGATYRIAGSFRTNSANGRATVKCAPSGSTSYSSAIDLTPAATTTNSTWVAFSGTVAATASSITIFLDSQTHVSGSTAKAAAFDGLTVTCVSPAVPPTITQHPGAQSVCPGGTAVFTVTATGDAPLSYQWQKNSSNLANGGHYSGANTATLTVSNADAGDAAGYRCVVSSGAGSATSNAASLTLKSATAITQHPQSQSVAAGATAVLTVAGTGDGTLTYLWQKNSVNLANGGHYTGVTTASLTVSSADSSDTGNYRCVITAGCGSVTSNLATLTVGPPAVPPDLDQDGDVDLTDFNLFLPCFSGPATPPTPGCENSDFDTDNDVDQADFGILQQCYSGVNIPADPNCVQ